MNPRHQMRARLSPTLALTLLMVGGAPPLSRAETPLNGAITYQGQLKSGGSPAEGSYDLEFRLFDDAGAGNQVGGPVTLNSVIVTDGLFTVQLNAVAEFGVSAFNGSRRWLEIRVNGTPLVPRQELTAAPYALYALAGPGSGAGPWQQNGSAVFYNSGNVGIGTNAPVSPLAIQNNSATNTSADFYAPNKGPNYSHAQYGATGDWYIRSSSSTGNVILQDGGGNVGIGTGAPTSKLHVIGGLKATSVLADSVEVLGYADPEPVIHAVNSDFLALPSGPGILGESTDSYGVKGDSTSNDGVQGFAHVANRSGVWGNNDSNGVGVAGSSVNGDGVSGTSTNSFGVHGRTSSTSFNVAGVLGEAVGNGQVIGVYGIASTGTTAAGVVGVGATGGYFASNGLGANTALYADGLCKVGTMQILGGSDLAEPFDVSGEDVQPGMVVVIDPSHPGKLMPCTSSYDRKVAGIISGAGGVATGLSMGHEGTLAHGKYPVALTGRVYCLADASGAAIEPGDLLTTSPSVGHAMKADDVGEARGAILGKAMSSLKVGKRGLVLVLVNLQ